MILAIQILLSYYAIIFDDVKIWHPQKFLMTILKNIEFIISRKHIFTVVISLGISKRHQFMICLYENILFQSLFQLCALQAGRHNFTENNPYLVLR